ncbi:MAG: hypothetical protein Q9195_000982 [Heterodermia aff. obscurata]
MPPEMQPQCQPPFVQSMRSVSFDTSTVASEQPGSDREGYQNRSDSVQETADPTTLDVVNGSFSDSQVDQLKHSLRHTRDSLQDHPPRPSNGQPSIDYAPLSQVHEPVLLDESGHGRDLTSPPRNSPRRDSGTKRPMQSQIILPNSSGMEVSIQSASTNSTRTNVPDHSQEHANKEPLRSQSSARRDPSKEDIDGLAKENLPWATVPSTPHSRFDPLQANTNGATIRLKPESSLSQPIRTERTSEDSNGTFHTAENAVRSRPGSAMVEKSPETPKAKQSQPSSYEDPVSSNGEDPTSTPILQSTTDEPTAQVQDKAENQGSEPSTDYPARTENGPYKPSPTTYDYLAREPSLDNIIGQVESDRSPSPVSPQHSLHNEPVRQPSTREPIYYSPQHDFDVKQTRDSALRHPRPSSRSGEVSGLSERPAFPLPSLHDNQAPKRIEANVHIERATGSYAEDKASPAINTSDRKSRSNRTSRNSVFFKNLGGSGTVGVPSIVSPVETQQQSPSYSMGTANESEKKSKRGSLFRSRPGDKSDDDGRGMASPSATVSAAPVDIWRQASPSTSKSSQLDGSLNSDPMKARNKLNRASTSGSKVTEEGGKKKRFSAIGSLFGKRSSRNQPSPAIQARHMQAGSSDQSATPQQPQYQTSYSSQVASVDQPRPQPESRQSQGQVGPSGSYRDDYSSPTRSDTMASQTSTPAWSQTAQRVSQPRQPSYKEPSAYVQDSSLRQQATSPSNAIRPGPARNSTPVSQNTTSDIPITKPRTSLFSRSKSRESSTTGRNRDSPGKSWTPSRDRDRQDRTGGSSGRQSLPVPATQGPQRVMTFSQFGESHITNNLDQQQQPSQNQSSDRQSPSSFNPHPQRTTSLVNNPQSRGPPRILTFNQFGENHIVESPSQSQLVQSSPQNKDSHVRQPNVITFQQFPSDPKSLPSQSSGRASPPPPPPPPKDDWHISKSRGSASQSIQADGRRQHGDTISRVSAPTAPSYHNPRSTSQPQPQPQVQQRQAPPPIQTEIPSARLSTFSPASNSAESRKARQRELESVAPSTEKEMTSVPAKNDASSEEKIVMSSSSYPGQEWQPSFAYDD